MSSMMYRVRRDKERKEIAVQYLARPDLAGNRIWTTFATVPYNAVVVTPAGGVFPAEAASDAEIIECLVTK